MANGILDRLLPRRRELTPEQQAQALEALRRAGIPTEMPFTGSQAAYFGSQLAPGAGALDASGYMPAMPSREQGLLDTATQGQFNPSLRQNFREGNYFDAALQGLGLLGDAAYTIPLAGAIVGPALKAPRAIQATARAARTFNPESVDTRFSPRTVKKTGEMGKADATRLGEAFEAQYESRNLDIPNLSIFDLEGRPFMTTMSDRTAAGGLLTRINNTAFDQPIDLRGGQDYMFDLMNSGQVWASDPKVVAQMLEYAKSMRTATGQDPIYIPWRMAPSGGDYSTMTGEAMVSYAGRNMSPSDIQAINKEIRETGINVSVRRLKPGTTDEYITESKNIIVPDFKGLDNPESAVQMRELTGNQRKAIQKILDKNRGLGGLSYTEARLAVADPTQLNAMDAGLQNVGIVDTSRGIISQSGHPTYAAGLPGEGIGRLNEDVGIYELLPELADFRRAKKTSTAYINPIAPSAQDIRALQMKPYTGILTEGILRRIQDRLANQ
jgi:hypothetical protein